MKRNLMIRSKGLYTQESALRRGSIRTRLLIAVYTTCLCACALVYTACPQIENPAQEITGKLPAPPVPDESEEKEEGEEKEKAEEENKEGEEEEKKQGEKEEGRDEEEEQEEGQGQEEDALLTLLTMRILRETNTGKEGEILVPDYGTFSKFTLKIVHADGTALSEQIILPGKSPNDETRLAVKSGEWTITATGFIDLENSGGSFAAVRGITKVTVQAGKPAEAPVVLNMTIPESDKQGSLAYLLEFPMEPVNTAILTVMEYNDSAASVPQAIVNLKAIGQKSGTVLLSPGLYQTELSLASADSQINRTAILRIHPGLETWLPLYTFGEEDFSRILNYSSVAAMTESLKNMTENTQETPYPVKLQGIDLSNMETDGDTMKTLSTALGTLKRYVDLDLSNCYGDRFLAGASTPGIVSLKLPESVTVIEAKAFAKSKTLVSVSMPGVKIIEDGDGAVDGAFYGCSLLKSVELSRVVTVGANAFYGCTSLASLSLPAVANINYRAFYGCTSLSSISLPVVKEIGDYAFNECISLFTQSLPNAEHIGDYAFYKCTSISSITLPRVADIGSMAFKYCEKLQTVELPVVVSIGNQAFYNTSDRNRIILGNTPPTLLTKTVFPSSIEGIYVPPEAVIVYKTASVINWNQTLIQKVKSL